MQRQRSPVKRSFRIALFAIFAILICSCMYIDSYSYPLLHSYQNFNAKKNTPRRCASSLVSGVSVFANGGNVEIQVEGFNVTAYVRVFDPETREWIRLNTFEWSIQPVSVVEIWNLYDVEKCCSPNNFTIPASGPNVTTLQYEKNMPNGSVASVHETRSKLPNGATFALLVETFSKATYRDVFGWKLPLTPTTAKVLFRIFDWPLASGLPQSDSPSWKDRSLAIFSHTLTKILCQEGSSNYLLKPQSEWPISLSGVYLSEPVVPGQIPPKNIGILQLKFLHRDFSLMMSYFYNSTYCGTSITGSFDETNCTWSPLIVSRFSKQAGDFNDPGVKALSQIPSGFDESQVQTLFLPTVFGLFIGNSTGVELDPNLDLLLGAGFDAAQTATDTSSVAIGVGVGVSAGIVGVAIVSITLAVVLVPSFRRKVMPFAKRREQQDLGQTPLNDEDESEPGNKRNDRASGWVEPQKPSI